MYKLISGQAEKVNISVILNNVIPEAFEFRCFKMAACKRLRSFFYDKVQEYLLYFEHFLWKKFRHRKYSSMPALFREEHFSKITVRCLP